ncbi:hypothetical protein O6H91_20G062100 [Diphasiastrum complanatum]|uniref:Uncharacterized protein n=1 Tax=Diphasiastrum complanatum TaxID=34168 RepID=A0ACC2ARA0_DIPCM|nr:hypothetical protein O6H91_20G062100 [Diphasiastrum complanatum]
MVGRKKTRAGPGQALIKQRSRTSQQLGSRAAGAGGEGRQVLESITHVTDLEEVLEQAEHAGRIFSALNPLPEILISTDSDRDFAKLGANEKKMQQRLEEALHQSSLTIPRRPKWHVGITSEELDVQERQAFLTWRRELARLEDNEKLVITPFEKNLDIWRQLWRVIERCDLVVIVVDARNPLFYRCLDLEAYVAEIDANKTIILLLNKADLIPLSVRILGRHELLERLQHEAEIVVINRQESTSSSQNVSGKLRSNELQLHHPTESDDEAVHEVSSEKELTQVISRHVAVGFVGYPNVGKSSTINALVGGKKTGVTSTPGKTKHFQTLIINEKLILCDCPGLVFPSFTSSKSEMVASGVLPIDRMTDYRGPIQAVVEQIPRETLEKTYGISLPSPKPYEPEDRPPSAAEFLRAYALSRGYVISSGLPDETRAARLVLKDYLIGKLLYCHTPPDEDNLFSSELHSNEGSDISLSDDDSEEEGPVNLELKGEEEAGQSPESIVAQKETVSEQEIPKTFETLTMHGQITTSTSAADSWSKLNGIFGDVEASNVRDSSHIRSHSSHKMQKKAPRKKDRSWRAGNDESDRKPMIRVVSKPVSHGAATLGQIIT